MDKCRASEPKVFARCAREAQKVEIGVLGVKMVQLLAARPKKKNQPPNFSSCRDVPEGSMSGMLSTHQLRMPIRGTNVAVSNT